MIFQILNKKNTNIYIFSSTIDTEPMSYAKIYVLMYSNIYSDTYYRIQKMLYMELTFCIRQI